MDNANAEAAASGKKKVTPGTLDIHPTENAIIINFTMQNVGEDIKVQKQKVLQVQELNQDSNIPALVQEIIASVKIIPQSRAKEVERLLSTLRDRASAAQSDREWLKRQLAEARGGPPNPVNSDNQRAPDVTDASMRQVDSYIEGLYDEMEQKIQATRRLLQLSKISTNREQLVKNEALMSALTRVLRDETKRSIELSGYIISIFCQLSAEQTLHAFITSNKIGDLSMKILDQEISRYNLWAVDFKEMCMKGTKAPNDVAIQAQVTKEVKTFLLRVKQQDFLIHVTLHLLMNLSHDVSIQMKMAKRGVLDYLLAILHRSRKCSPGLIALALTFIQRLTIYVENKDLLAPCAKELISRISFLLSIDVFEVQSLVLKIAFNLSHDREFRIEFLRHTNFVARITEMLKGKRHSALCVRILYQLSIEDKFRPQFTDKDALPVLIAYMFDGAASASTVAEDQQRIFAESAAILVNLSSVEAIAEIICGDGGLKLLLKRAFKSKEVLLFKLLHALSLHEEASYMPVFADFVENLVVLVLEVNSQQNYPLLVESLGLLANFRTIIDTSAMDKLSDQYNLVDFATTFLREQLSSESGNDSNNQTSPNDDVVLEVVNLISLLAHSEKACVKMHKAKVIPLLQQLLLRKRADSEIVLQVIYCMYLFMTLESLAKYIATKTDMVAYMIDLLFDPCPAIRELCGSCIDIVGESSDSDFVGRIRDQKFRWYNAEWLKLVEADLASGAKTLDNSTRMKSGKSSKGPTTKQASTSDSEDEESDDMNDRPDFTRSNRLPSRRGGMSIVDLALNDTDAALA